MLRLMHPTNLFHVTFTIIGKIILILNICVDHLKECGSCQWFNRRGTEGDPAVVSGKGAPELELLWPGHYLWGVETLTLAHSQNSAFSSSAAQRSVSYDSRTTMTEKELSSVLPPHNLPQYGCLKSQRFFKVNVRIFFMLQATYIVNL